MSHNPNFGKVSGKSCHPDWNLGALTLPPQPRILHPEARVACLPSFLADLPLRKGQPYIDEVGTFKKRIQWVGDPHRKDGSIVIHNLDYGDSGTFTCDVKNPPDIVGKTSQVPLYVFEKRV